MTFHQLVLEADLEKIAAAGAGRWLPRYSKLFREGAVASAFFVLLKVRSPCPSPSP